MSAFAILTVCSGNICRSPLAEQLLRAGLADWTDLTVSSAGTIALAGDRMPDEAAALSVRHGGSPSAHAARQLVEAQIRQADLVLGMSREHRRAVVQLLPAASRYTFTLREFARLVAGATEDDFDDIAQLPPNDVGRRWTEAVDIAASHRGLEPAGLPEDDDVIDPYRESQAIYDLSAGQLVPAVQTVVSYFRRAATATVE